jgi:N-acetylmuramoyl-L-alanine amidase
MNHLAITATLTLALTLVACQSPSTAKKGSVYGDRPGPRGFTTVVIDAGHGGKDPGARARGLIEKNLALDLAQRVRAELSPRFKVIMVRSHDHFIDLDDRVRIANRYPNAILVSIHFNHGSRSRSGPETYYWRTDSYSLASRLQQQMSRVSSARSSAGLVRRRLRLTRNPIIPSVLIECGYLTSARDAAQFSSPAQRQLMAQAIAKAIRDQATHGDSGMGRLPPPIYAPPSRAGDARG